MKMKDSFIRLLELNDNFNEEKPVISFLHFRYRKATSQFALSITLLIFIKQKALVLNFKEWCSGISMCINRM